MEESNGRKRSRSAKKTIISIAIGLIILALAALCTWQFFEMGRLRNPEHAAEQSKIDARELKDKVSQLMQLPEEEATVATVEDAEKLAGQEFFASAQNGDKVLIFTEAKKAVIYRPSENRIINSGPIVINSTDTPVTTE